MPCHRPDRFCPDLPAAEVDRRLRASLGELQQAEENTVLWFAEMARRRLYREFGFGSMMQYASVRLGFGKRKTYQFLRLAASLRALPHLREAVSTGAIPWTKAREVAGVATAATETAWIQEAQASTNRALEERVRQVKRRARTEREAGPQLTLVENEPCEAGSAPEPPHHAPESVPVDLHVRLSPEEYARYEALIEALQKGGDRSPRERLLLAGLELLLAERQRGAERTRETRETETGPEECPRVHSPRYQVVIQLCEACETSTVATSRGPQKMSPAELRAALCDGHVERADPGGGKRRATTPPRLRRAALRRDRFRCQAVGCGSARFLDVHHRVHREYGGKDMLENLVTLCAPCHKALHHAEEQARTG